MIVGLDFEIGFGASYPKWDIRKEWEDPPTKLEAAEVVKMALKDPEVMEGVLHYLLNENAGYHKWRHR